MGQIDATDYGFSPEADGLSNAQALQRAVDCGGTVAVMRPGVYEIASTTYIGSHTTLVFGNGVVLRKVPNRGPFAHVLLNRGALSRSFDVSISVEGLRLQVNGVDKTMDQVYGLRGQIAFLRVRDLRIERFRCDDLDRMQFAIHVCTFEDLAIEDVIIRGRKDGIHLGRGRRFAIRRGVFQTHDDAVALNAHDYATSNPELGWIEDGIVEDCHDLPEAGGGKPTGFFCRLVAGAWTDWEAGMEVQHSDTVVSRGRVYRVQARPDGTVYASVTQPEHTAGSVVLDGINWGLVQDDVTYNAGVRNVVFRNIFLHSPRPSFSIHRDEDRYSRSFHPGAPAATQKQISLDGVHVLHDAEAPLLSIATPVDVVSASRCRLARGGIAFRSPTGRREFGPTTISLVGCAFTAEGEMDLLTNEMPNKPIVLKTVAGDVTHESFQARVVPGSGQVSVRSDLPGLSGQ